MNWKVLLAIAGAGAAGLVTWSYMSNKWKAGSDQSFIFPLANGTFFDTRNATIFNPQSGAWTATGSPDAFDIPVNALGMPV